MKLILIIFAIFGAILLLIIGGGLFSTQQLQNLTKFSQEKLSQLQPSTSATTDTSQDEQKQFSTKDGKLTFTYPASWIEIPTNSRVVFKAAKFTLQGTSAQLLVTALDSPNKPLQQIIKDMQASNATQQWDMQVLHFQATEKEALFDALYSGPNRETLKSQEKILPPYVISIISQETGWQEFENEAASIIQSARLML